MEGWKDSSVIKDKCRLCLNTRLFSSLREYGKYCFNSSQQELFTIWYYFQITTIYCAGSFTMTYLWLTFKSSLVGHWHKRVFILFKYLALWRVATAKLKFCDHGKLGFFWWAHRKWILIQRLVYSSLGMWKGSLACADRVTMVKEITYNHDQMSDDNLSLQWMWLEFRNNFTNRSCVVFDG